MDAEVAVAELALNHHQLNAFVCHLDDVGMEELARREAAPDARNSCRAAQLGADGGGRPWPAACRAVDDAEQRAHTQFRAGTVPELELLPCPLVHADLAAPAALAATDEHRAATAVEV